MRTATAESAEPAAAPGRAYGYYAVLALVLAAAIAPLWLVSFPEMLDYPSHLARCYILAHYGASPLWQHFYRVEFGPIPNLAMDVIVPALAHWLPILVSGKIFLTLCALLYVLGCDALGKAAWGRPHWMALLAGMTFCNSNLILGRVNYMFGLGLFFCVFAYWLRRRRQLSGRRFLVLCVLGAAVYLAHLGSMAVLGACCCTVAAMDWRRERKLRPLLGELGWLAVPVLLLLAGFLRRNGRVGHVLWASWQLKIWQLMSLVRLHDMHFAAGVFLGLLLCVGALAVGSRVQRELLAAAAVLFGCYAVLPLQLFTSDYVDVRLIAPACVLLLLAIHPRRQRVQAVALAAAMLLLAERVIFIARDWIQADARARITLAMGAMLPRGASVDVLAQLQLPPATVAPYDPHYFTAAKTVDYWTISRESYESNVFAQAGQQPLIKRPQFATCWPGAGKGCLQRFDYVWTDEPLPRVRARLEAAAEPVARRGGITLWRRKPVAAPGSRAGGLRSPR
ncbi:MAG: hypothetical protein ACRD04_04230 [Terriglobales bacterium]